jgi:hypothetical protein
LARDSLAPITLLLQNYVAALQADAIMTALSPFMRFTTLDKMALSIRRSASKGVRCEPIGVGPIVLKGNVVDDQFRFNVPRDFPPALC